MAILRNHRRIFVSEIHWPFFEEHFCPLLRVRWKVFTAFICMFHAIICDRVIFFFFSQCSWLLWRCIVGPPSLWSIDKRSWEMQGKNVLSRQQVTEHWLFHLFLHRFRNLQRIPTPARGGWTHTGTQIIVYFAVNDQKYPACYRLCSNKVALNGLTVRCRHLVDKITNNTPLVHVTEKFQRLNSFFKLNLINWKL